MTDLEEVSSSNRFKLTTTQLNELCAVREVKKIADLGGMQDIAKGLRSNLENGLDESDEELNERIAAFGKNVYKEPPLRSYMSLLINALKEPILILLLVCSIVEIILGVSLKDEEHDPATGWIDGAAILIAVILVSNVTAYTDYDKEKKFRALNSVKNDRKVKVLRNASDQVIQIGEVQVGDVVKLDTGDWVPADGLYIDGHALAIDESNMTGEPDSIKKNVNKPFLLSGTQVTEGGGTMLVVAVGMNSEWGKTMEKLTEDGSETPLQESLGQLAKYIGYIGMVTAVLVFVVLVIQFLAKYASDWEWSDLAKFLQFFTLAITIVVVAVPEGLPLAVTLSLAYSMKAMLKDNNLVRHLDACETMGGATNICSDKTGTLTENRMTVTHAWFADRSFDDRSIENQMTATLSKNFVDLLVTGISVNSSAFLRLPKKANQKIEFIGSKTECALLVLTNKLKYDYNEIRKKEKILHVFPFSSEKKRMSTITQHENGGRLHAKGASEIILGLCDQYMDNAGNLQKLAEDKKQELLRSTIEVFASEGLRTLTLAYKEVPILDDEYTSPPDDHLILLGIVGIKDPLRPEVPDAIKQCKNAGITVRMVTGDNKLTASKIATDCGILHEGELVMEGPDFRKLDDAQLDDILPRLRVLARSSPSDKYRLVTRLRALHEVVAVTGDGTNDGPALKAADVGFGMGIAGTEIAKEASDIIIMDDNFASIVKAVMWGRCVRRNIQKFLQFQLTVNIVALTVVFIAAASGRGEPIKPIQFLWVNLIQDTLAALALATEQPTPDLLEQKPAGRTERLITPVMWRNMVCVGLYQIIILFMMLYAGDSIWGLDPIDDPASNYKPTVQYTMIFNTFVFFQLFNEINCRRLDNEWNALQGFFSNWIFLSIVISTAFLQVIFVQFGDIALGTKPLDTIQWFSCLGLAFSVMFVSAFVRVVVPVPEWRWLKYNTKILGFGGNNDNEEEQELKTVESKD